METDLLLYISSKFQCRTLLPPPEVPTTCLIEMYFTGDRKLSLCAHDMDSAA
ncbi:hypothetical protein DPMN_129315 [Dreissena polymorpha]|uniref:Uncharacterized protein n=1 Tax=Dreissena polymorpha TaxID=45954 RepID=A0A9D4H0Z1_DREPO|nr:hypothetical protein DPMN_129315 [Dreissena polymorpha]